MHFAVSIGYLAQPALPGWSVHSSFDNAVNLCRAGDRQMLALVSERYPDGPSAVRIAAPVGWGRCFQRGQTIALRNGVLCAEGVRDAAIGMRGARIWSRPDLPCGRVIEDAGCRLESLTGLLGQQQAWLMTSAEAEMPDNTDALSALVGMGQGLTPAGDDFLVGYLCLGRVFAAMGDRPRVELNRLAGSLRRRLCRTGDISEHHLRLALDGHFNSALCDLRSAMFQPAANYGSIRLAASDLAAIGASSGRDTLAGVAAAFRRFAAFTVHAYAGVS
ncbi:DUF2877 domain-containing protein [Palleronia sediminis]|nr:DUF2877 domain-containing protein [Palleronia sediminis]